MKTTILIKDGRKQLVLDPETKADEMAVKMFKDLKAEQVYLGSFYDCQGGWTRSNSIDKEQLIIVFDDPEDQATVNINPNL